MGIIEAVCISEQMGVIKQVVSDSSIGSCRHCNLIILQLTSF